MPPLSVNLPNESTIVRALDGATSVFMRSRFFFVVLLASAILLPAALSAPDQSAPSVLVDSVGNQPSPEKPKWTDTAQAWAQIIGLLAVVTTLWSLSRQFKDRSTTVLLELDTRFSADKILAARGMIEDKDDFEKLKLAIRWYLSAHGKADANSPAPATSPTKEDTDQYGDNLERLDALLRFYVLLMGVREAGQVHDRPLRITFAYWLNHYWYSDRVELRLYVNTYFRTVAQWLRDDQAKAPDERFFRPNEERTIPEYRRHPSVV